MSIISIVTLLGGLTFFLYGMHVMSTGLEKMAGGKLEGMLKQMTSNPLKSLALGAGITIAIQSSSALTVMLVGLVNSGIMDIGQTVGVIMGSNIGTTLTAWLLSMIGIETDNAFIALLKPENFSMIFAFVGIVMLMMSKVQKRRDTGTVFIGFAVLMYGMKLMSGAVSPLTEMPEFTTLLTAFQNPILGVLVGAIFTGIIQSSAASVGILQAFALTGNITYGMAIPVIMGQNIGTCVTALISSIGVSKNAKKVAIIHISFNLIGTVVWLAVFYILHAIIKFSFIDTSINAFGIAVVHSIFNILTTLLLIPFDKHLVRIANKLLPAKDDEESMGIKLDERLLATPSVAIKECDSLTSNMCELARDTVFDAISLLARYDETVATNVLKREDILDEYEDWLGTYLLKISTKSLSASDSCKVSKMLHVINDFERLGDQAVNILNSAKELHDKKLEFSEDATRELDVLISAIYEIIDRVSVVYKNDDAVEANFIEPLEQTIDDIVTTIKSNHIKRLQIGVCTIELGFIINDVLGSLERVSDHCSNIAVAVIETSRGSFDTHKYLGDIKYGNSKFNNAYEMFCEKYTI